jgi:hypothetical protein
LLWNYCDVTFSLKASYYPDLIPFPVIMQKAASLKYVLSIFSLLHELRYAACYTAMGGGGGAGGGGAGGGGGGGGGHRDWDGDGDRDRDGRSLHVAGVGDREWEWEWVWA